MVVNKIPVVHLQMVKDGEVEYGKRRLDSPEKAAKMVRKFLGMADREYLVVCGTDGRMKPTFIHVAGVGTVNFCLCSIPEIFKTALLSNAAYILLFHNHPSGDVTPSREDMEVTEKIKKAGNLLGVELRDHIILGDNDTYYSFREHAKDWKGETDWEN